MNKEIDKILDLMDKRIEVLERSNPSGATEKYLRNDFTSLVKQLIVDDNEQLRCNLQASIEIRPEFLNAPKDTNEKIRRDYFELKLHYAAKHLELGLNKFLQEIHK